MNASFGPRIKCDLTSLNRARSGAIWGAVWIEAGTEAFPGQSWGDMPAAVLLAAVKATRSLRHPYMPTYFPFFDGPYDVRMTLSDDGMIALQGRRKGTVHFRGSVLSRLWAAELRDCARAFLDQCDENGWRDYSDISELSDELKVL